MTSRRKKPISSLKRNLSPERRHELGSIKGGRAEVPKGLALLTPEKRAAIRAKALATRQRKAAQREQTPRILFPNCSQSKVG